MELNWENVEQAIQHCNRCALCQRRSHAVPGEGNKKAGIVCVGEGPGQQEDEQGRPFVGPAGQLLDKMLQSVGFSREDVYITNVVKCRPPMNRNPEPDEIQACLPYLRAQVSLIRPKILFCLGSVASRALIDPNLRITRDRGQWVERKGYHMMASFHPSALLRDASGQWKRQAYADLKSLRATYDEIMQKG